MDYIEPFIGAGSVFLNKKPSLTGTEVINDLDLGVIQIYRALRDEPDNFIGNLRKIKYCESVFKRELKRQGDEFADYVDHATNEIILRRMSRGGLKKAFAWSERLRGGQPGDVNAWKTIMGLLPEIAGRLQGSNIFNTNGIQIIKGFDDPNALCYADPPYDPDSRVSKSVYGHEMTTEQHIELSEELHKFKGKAIISGYMSPLYIRLYSDWRCEKKKIANHSSQQKKKEYKTEAVWLNY